MTKWAVKVPFMGDWLYVTKASDKSFEFEPVTYDSYEEAMKAAHIWKNKNTGEIVSKVVEFREDIEDEQ